MVSFDEAQRIIKSYAIPRCIERVDLFHALHRTLADDLFSDISMPPFNKSAMDGYACRKSDVKNQLQIIEEIPAGTAPNKIIGKNQCARIMTGAMVPEGADLVIMKEDVEEISPDSILCTRETARTNICYTAEDVKAGDLVLKKGDVILPAQIAILASVGCDFPMVYQIPPIAIISTGNELVEPDQTPDVSKIRNSNSYQLAAQLQQMGMDSEYLGIIPDEEETLKKVLKFALSRYRIIIISGGVSVGDFDFVPKILKQLDINIQVHGMDVRPGKHLLFGEKANHFVFGMPGNPVSSFVQFEVLVKPFLKTLTGRIGEASFLFLPLEADFMRKKVEQLLFVPVAISKHGTILPIEYHGSAHIHAYTNAQGIMEIPCGVSFIKKGEIACVRPL